MARKRQAPTGKLESSHPDMNVPPAPPSRPATVGINPHAVVSLALYGTQDRAEAMYRETYPAMRRIRVRARRAAAFDVPPRGKGSMPSIHDIKRWLDDLKNDEAHADDVDLLKRLNKTLRDRCRPEVVEAVEKGEAAGTALA